MAVATQARTAGARPALRASIVLAATLGCSGCGGATQAPAVRTGDAAADAIEGGASAVADAAFDVLSIDGSDAADSGSTGSDGDDGAESAADARFDGADAGARCSGPLTFADPDIETFVRKAIGLPSGPSHSADVADLTTLDLVFQIVGNSPPDYAGPPSSVGAA